jgi:hypothetical protein
MESIAKSGNFLIEGGIGDFLQNLPFVLANRSQNYRYFVLTHFTDAHVFFDTIRQPIQQFFFYSDLNQLKEARASLAKMSNCIRCPRSKYLSNINLVSRKLLFKDTKPVVGVHVGGSEFSIKTLKQFGHVSKALPPSLPIRLLSDTMNVQLFGSEAEISKMKLHERKNFKIVCDRNIMFSLSYVAQCTFFVGSDSVFKTMSSMLKIPTIVWLGDYRDDFRDQMFINPYLSDGVMSVIRYRNLESQEEFDRAIDLTKEILSKLSRKGSSAVPISWTP